MYLRLSVWLTADVQGNLAPEKRSGPPQTVVGFFKVNIKMDFFS